MRTAYRVRAYPTPEQEAVLNRTSGCVRLVWNKTLAEVDPTTVVVRRESDGRFYVTFPAETPDLPPLPATGHSVGVDANTKAFVHSTGEVVTIPDRLRRREIGLARHQRRLARCRRDSANRVKTKQRVAAAHRRIRDIRRDRLHKQTTHLVRGHDLIAIEDLAVKNMTRRAGRVLVVIDRWHPSSKTCGGCGGLNQTLRSSDRHWSCRECGARHDRDVNAAKNIMTAGRAAVSDLLPGVRGDACGADVRHLASGLVRSVVKQESLTAR